MGHRAIKEKEKQVLNKNSDVAQQDVEWGTLMLFSLPFLYTHKNRSNLSHDDL